MSRKTNTESPSLTKDQLDKLDAMGKQFLLLFSELFCRDKFSRRGIYPERREEVCQASRFAGFLSADGLFERRFAVVLY